MPADARAMDLQEIFSPLACGGKLVLAEPGGEKDTQYLADVCMDKRITFVIYVPSQLDALMQACTRSSLFPLSLVGHLVHDYCALSKQHV